MDPIKGNSGDLLTFRVKANSAAASVGDILLNNIKLSTEDNTSFFVDNQSIRISGNGGEPVILGNVIFSAKENPIIAKPGESYTVEIQMDNDIDIRAIQAKITLPEGLTITPNGGDDFGYTDRIPMSLNIQSKAFEDNSYNFNLSGTTADVIVGNSGTLFTFTVYADENLSDAPSFITVDNIVVSNTKAESFTVEGVEIKVIKQTSTGISAIEAAEAEGGEIYTVGGRRVQQAKGLVIVRSADGKVQKIAVR